MKKTVAADIFIKNNKSPSIFVSFFAPYLYTIMKYGTPLIHTSFMLKP